MTDDGPVYLPAKQLRPYYPNLLSIHSQWMMHRQEDAGVQVADARRTSHQEVFSRFLEDVCHTEVTQEDMDLLEDILRELNLDEGGGKK